MLNIRNSTINISFNKQSYLNLRAILLFLLLDIYISNGSITNKKIVELNNLFKNQSKHGTKFRKNQKLIIRVRT